MILVAAALLCVLSVPLTGGRLSRLVDLPLRWGWAALVGLALQVGMTSLASTGSAELLTALHLASYALAGACIVANLRIAGVPVLALGAALNCAAIVANHGVMPASARAMDLAGLAPSDHFANSAAVEQPRLLPLGDVIPVPGPWPLGNVMSFGDVLILVGLLIVLHRACRSRPSTIVPAAAAA